MKKTLYPLKTAIALWVLGSLNMVSAQNSCGITVQAGDDVTICAGQSTMLNGQVSGGTQPAIQWSPPTGLNNPNILNPVASPTQTTTYTLTARDTSDNLIINGGFETQDILPATTDYTLAPNPIAIGINAPNYYAILDVPQILQVFGCNPDIGLYTLVVHGSNGVQSKIWCQTVNVEPNREYILKYKVFGIPYLFAPAPIIVAEINGDQIGSVTAPNSQCGMASGSFTWQSGNNTSAQICLANSRVAGLGSMCSIDDIQFFELCEASDEVTVTVDQGSTEQVEAYMCPGTSYTIGNQTFNSGGQYSISLQNINGCDSIIQLNLQEVQVNADIQISNPLNCYFEEATLSALGSSGSFGISGYQWSTLNGNILSDPSQSTVVINAGGTYFLEVFTSNGEIECSHIAEIEVPIDTAAPVFFIEEPPHINCQDTAIVITANGDLLPPVVSIQWNTNNGNILAGRNTLQPLVNRVGTYSLTIIDLSNGCIGFDQVLVEGSADIPRVAIDSFTSINCKDTIGHIFASADSAQQHLRIQWITSDGEFLGNTDSLIVQYLRGGTYTLITTDTTTGCSRSLNITLDEDKFLPSINIIEPDTINCQRSQIYLTAILDPDTIALRLQWTTIDGNILSRNDTSIVLVSRAGIYTLRVENPQNGCLDTLSIQVLADANVPVIQFNGPNDLNCQRDSLIPDMSCTSTGPSYRYLWQLEGGFVPDSNSLSPVLRSAGIYIFSILNIDNLCIVTDTIEIEDNSQIPILRSIEFDTLTCIRLHGSIRLDWEDNANLRILWSSSTGGLINQSPEYNLPGWYFFQAIDTLNFCETRDSIFIVQNTDVPLVVIDPPGTIDCQNSDIVLSGVQSTGQGELQYAWTTRNGSFIGSTDQPTVRVNTGGTWYWLEITDTRNGCRSVDSVFIEISGDIPSIDLPDTLALTCSTNDISITPEVNPADRNYGFLWTTTDGILNSDPTQATLNTNHTGTYRLEVTDQLNGCSAIAVLTVMRDTTAPDILIHTVNVITCSDSIGFAEIGTSGDLSRFIVLWEVLDGHILGPNDTWVLTTTSAGVFKISLTDTENGCISVDTIEIQAYLDTPTAIITGDNVLECDRNLLILSAENSRSSDGSGLAYFWSTDDGTIAGNATGITCSVASPGIYRLLVRQESNGCESEATFEVSSANNATIQWQVEPPLCPEDSATLLALDYSGLSNPITFQIQGNNQSYPINQVVRLAPGNYLINITDANQCQLVSAVEIESVQETLISYPDSISQSQLPFSWQLVALPDLPESAMWTWYPSNPGILIDSNGRWNFSTGISGKYDFIITFGQQCRLSGSVWIEPVQSETSDIYVPNAFSPSIKDGINDRFYPMSSGNSERLIDIFEIYDRWGNMVFKKENFTTDRPEHGWDGTYRSKELHPGTYVWFLWYKTSDGKTIKLKGEVCLL